MDLRQLERDGYQVVRSVVSAAEIAGLLREAERLRQAIHASPLLDARLRILQTTSRSGKIVFRGLQNAHFVSPDVDALRLHPGIGGILRRVLGPDITTVLTSLFWKLPGDSETGVAYHQDAGFRQPVSAFRNLAVSYLQIAIALDPQDDGNGGLRFAAGSHREGRLFPRPRRSVLAGDAGEAELRAMGLSPADARPVRLEPGDLVMWNAFTVHGSSPNRSQRDRRSFAVASMRASDCDLGCDAYVGGRPAPALRPRDAQPTQAPHHKTELTEVKRVDPCELR
jgi:ectoine hydroxylase-related dioxygenase (phytanoyl-CoA dioxygenase family)